jgi:hypothetical protein
MKRSDIENAKLNDSEDLCALVEKLGYSRGRFGQLQNRNGSFVSSLTDFLDDNPDAMDAIRDWIVENYDLEDENEECEEV